MSMPTHPEVVTLDPNDAEQVKRLMTHYAGSPLTDNEVPDMQKALRAMLTPPLPEEPPEWAVVRANHVTLVRMDPGSILRPRDYRWWRIGTEEIGRTWPEVCALGTPEVLEPDSTKALRERVSDLQAEYGKREASQDTIRERLTAERNRAWATLKQVREFASACRDQYEASDYSESIPLGQVADSLEGLLTLAGYAVKPSATEDEPAEPAPVEVTEEPTDPNVRVRDDDGRVWRRVRGNANCPRCWTIVGPGSGLHRTWLTLLPDCGPLTLIETGEQS